MKKGFTLLELIVVIIIIGILATLGFTQYGKMVERSRGSEARTILGDIRKFAAAHYLEYNTLTGTIPFNDSRANIGAPGGGQIPNTCTGQASHYFSYALNPAPTATTVSITATRCTTGGRPPAAAGDNTLALASDLSSGTDTWTSAYGY